jgi:broad specificity phosphatase PhoE
VCTLANLSRKQICPSKEFLLVRHGQDKDILNTKLDQPLIPDSLNLVNGLASCVKTMFLKDIVFTIMYGPSKRTSQTSQHLAKMLSESGYIVNLEENADIKEFYQGQFHVDYSFLVNGKYTPLETAWEIFKTKVLEGEFHYKFGDPVIDSRGRSTFPLLQNFFTEYGETQFDFLFRIRRFLSRMGKINRSPNHMCVVVTHQAVASRIQREITGKRLPLEYCGGVFVPYPKI